METVAAAVPVFVMVKGAGVAGLANRKPAKTKNGGEGDLGWKHLEIAADFIFICCSSDALNNIQTDGTRDELLQEVEVATDIAIQMHLTQEDFDLLVPGQGVLNRRADFPIDAILDRRDGRVSFTGIGQSSEIILNRGVKLAGECLKPTLHDVVGSVAR